MTIRLVPLQLDHLDEVEIIEKKSFPTPWTRDAFVGELTRNGLAYYYACIKDDKLLGYGGMWLIVDEAHITNVAVHPDWRGQRIGEYLISKMIAAALEKGMDKMTLEVRPSNFAARKLYERMGFKKAGLRKGYYTDTQEDAIIMWKNLLD